MSVNKAWDYLFFVSPLSCVSCVPFSCVLIWFVSCPCLVSLLVNSCPANYLWLSCVVIVLSVQLVFVWSTPYSRCFCVSLALSCPALFELKTVILSYPRLRVPRSSLLCAPWAFLMTCFYDYFLIPCFYCCDYHFFNDYFTSFYVKYFELPLWMKGAI